MLAFGSGVALAFSSDDLPVRFEDDWPAFSLVQFDTGFLPGGGSPINVRFLVQPSGGVSTTIDATSTLVWPDAVTHHVATAPGAGTLALDASIDLVAELQIDIPFVYTGSFEVWREGADFVDATTFDTLLLGGSATVVAEDDDLVDPFVLSYSLIPGLDIGLEMLLLPAVEATVVGLEVVTAGPDGIASQLTDVGTVRRTLEGGEASLPLELVHRVEAHALLDLVIRPEVVIGTWLGDVTLVAFDIPIPMLDATETRDSAPALADHPLPAAGELPASHDFGELPVGAVTNLLLPVEDLGLLALEATVTVDGDPAFTVFPDRIVAEQGLPDGVVVTFAPTEGGRARGTLVFETNDPSAPLIVVGLDGQGLSPEATTTPTGDTPPPDGGVTIDDDVDAKGGCGCAGVPEGGLGVAVAALLLWRRRRRG